MAEYEHAERISRQQAAERLADMAFELVAGGAIEVRTGGRRMRLPVADTILLTCGSRPQGRQVAVEVKLSWSAEAARRDGITPFE